MTLKTAIEKLLRDEDLNQSLCAQVMEEILHPDHNALQIAAFLTLLRKKRETPEELCAIVTSLRSKMKRLFIPYPVLDIDGTGGDGHHTVNISTGSAILAASCGIKVSKHGNRSVSSLTGSADVLEALGINIQCTPEHVVRSIDSVGIGFCYAPLFHPVLQMLRQLRTQLNVPTTLNYLGPLLNPAEQVHLLLGVADPVLVPRMAEVLRQMNPLRSIVVHGMGLDEVSCVGPMQVIETSQHTTRTYQVDPHTLDLSYCTLSDLRGGNAKTNAALLLDTFKGKKGPLADTLTLNVAIALYLFGIQPSIQTGLTYAKTQLASGAAFTLLNNWSAFSHEQ